MPEADLLELFVARLDEIGVSYLVTGSVAALAAKPGGGEAWLHSLRSVPYKEASLALQVSVLCFHHSFTPLFPLSLSP